MRCLQEACADLGAAEALDPYCEQAGELRGEMRAQRTRDAQQDRAFYAKALGRST